VSLLDFADVRSKARREGRRAWVGGLGRVGLAAQGVCFGLIGALAFGLAVGVGGASTDPQGAFAALARGGWTRVVLVLLAIGFAAYAMWRLAQALLDRGGMGADAGGLGRRGIQLCQGLIYIGLTISAVHVLLGAHPKPNAQQHTAAGILGWPGGPELVGFAAAVLFVIAGVTVYWALSRRFKESLATEEMGQETERVVTATGIVGLSSLGFVTAVVAWFLLKAAIEFDARDAVSIGGALSKLAHAGYGSYLLGAVAAGFVVFGIFDLLQARYHKA
jgi:Domain of Unknown Function (DUF1206)